MDNVTPQELTAALPLVQARLDPAWRARLAAGDFAANLLAHFRTRTTPRLLFSPDRLPTIAALCRQHDPDELAWEMRIADEAVAGRLYAASNAYCERFVAVDRDAFDFSAYEHPDPQSIHGLNRNRWCSALARAYWQARDPKYFDTLMREWDFYASKVPMDPATLFPRLHAMGKEGRLLPPYHELDNFIRLTNWWSAFWLALHAAEMTPPRCVVLLARCLRLFDLVAARGIHIHRHNFTAMQMEALYLWAAALPEVLGMDVWRAHARCTAEAGLNQAVFEDGVQWEKSAGYHAGCIRWYGVPFLFGQVQGEPWAPEYGERLRRMGEFLDAIVTPDGNVALLADSDRNRTWAGPLALLHCLFPDLKFRRPVAPNFFTLWVTDGREWDPAETVGERPRAQVFPAGGVAVAHNAARPADAMVILDNGPTNAGHSHPANLCVHYEALGRPVLVDPGRAVYRADDARAWATRALSHNTTYIEDTPVPAAGPMRGPGEFLRLQPGDPRLGEITVTDRSGAYQLLSDFSAHAAERAAWLRRFVSFPQDACANWLAVVDCASGGQAHTWTTSWLLPASQPARAVRGGYRVELDSGLHVQLACAASEPMTLRDDAMYWFASYDQRSPARWLRFSARSTRTQRCFLFCVSAAPVVVMPQVVFDGSVFTWRIGTKEHRIEDSR